MAVLEKSTYGDDADAGTIVAMVNLFGAVANNLRQTAGAKGFPHTESLLLTALITFAGALHGEVLEMATDQGDTSEVDLTEEQMVTLLLTNFKVGIDAGRAKVKRIREEFLDAGRQVH